MQQSDAGKPVAVHTGKVPVFRILGSNPGAMTGPGTNSYLIGDQTLCLLDPGPRDELQLGNFLAAIGSRRLAYILVTHTHGDHSPGALALQAATGAELVGLPAPIPQGHDTTFKPARQWHHGDLIDCGEYVVRLVHTPGHVSNHICYLLEADGLLFTGDHVLQGTTSVILPPDGDMGDYLASLRELQSLPLQAFAPGHGAIMTEPQHELSSLIAHRLRREEKVLHCLQLHGPCTLESLVLTVYDDVAPHLLPWAKKTLLAHLLKLQRERRAELAAGIWSVIAGAST
jgi:glyoxylase-like metal-dependent hydrolase (beta-lactamase superfamily II)